MNRRRPIWLLVIVLVGSVAGSRRSDAGADQSKPPKEDYYELHKLLVDALDQVERNYVKEVSRRELVEAAVRGILRELDPYSAYIGPDQLDRFRATVDNKFGGIGIQVSLENGSLRVLSPLAGTPAYRAGILAGDRIVEIDGKSTKGMGIEDAVRRLKGKEGTQVAVTVIHQGKPDPEKVTITREIIRVNTVLGDHRKEDDTWDFMLDRRKRIGYVRLTAFSGETARELQDAIQQLAKDDFRALILDLRFNPGGLLRSAIEISDLFISDGRLVSTKGRGEAGPERTWDAHQEGTLGDFPVVVLVNRYSASGSEIVSACLQDHKRGVVMGERTWGKGSVQNVIPMEQGRSALKLTTASYRRPSGQNIHRFPGAEDDEEWGVRPDKGFELRLTDEEMLALVRDRRERDVIRPKELAEADTAQSDPKLPPEGGSNEKQKPEPPDDQAASKPEPPDVVDPHLRMAVDYLSGELARAD